MIGRGIKITAAIISLLYSLYWLYRTIFCDDVQWLSFFTTAAVSVLLFFLARKRK